MIDTRLIEITVFATIFTWAVSLLGLFPTSRLRRQPRGPVRLIHLFSLPLIVAVIYAYLDWAVPQNQHDTDRLGYTIGCSLVAVFWWLIICRRVQGADRPFAVSLYLTSTVLFGFLCPLMMFYNLFLLFDRVTLPKTPLVLGFVAHLVLYIVAFLATYWFTRIMDHANNHGEPCDEPKSQ
ncbi:hypothetical protein [Planctomycetes bacterium CA13]|uniref:hypothetical protein n=1 Tax=Novipirellula herctigrandis TaxID=2527986 RepID=UPI0011B6BA78